MDRIVLFCLADGTQFSPGVDKQATLYAFSPEVCRWSVLDPLGLVTLIPVALKMQHITDVTEGKGRGWEGCVRWNGTTYHWCYGRKEEGRGRLCAMKWHVVVMSSDMNCRSGPGIGNGRSVQEASSAKTWRKYWSSSLSLLQMFS